MSDWIIAMGTSNLLVSVALASLAAFVQWRTKRTWFVHFLWLVVLVKLVVPPVFATDWIRFADVEEPVLAAVEWSEASAVVSEPSAWTDAGTTGLDQAVDPKSWLLGLWALGSLALVILTLVRLRRFDKLLAESSRPVDDSIRAVAEELASSFGLWRTPTLLVVEAQLTPLVWWRGGRPKVVVPKSMVESMAPDGLRLLLAHEFAHVLRRDHVVRWLECAATCLFWWNPALWLARRELRTAEEHLADAVVVERLGSSPKSYARSLLDAVELLVPPAPRPPVLGTPLLSGEALEKRLTMILSRTHSASPSRVARGFTCFVAFVLLPLGVARADKPDFEAVAKRLMSAIDAGEVNESQAQAMFGALAEQHFAEALEAHREVGLAKRAKKRLDGAARQADAEFRAGRISQQELDERLESLRLRERQLLDREAERKAQRAELTQLERAYLSKVGALEESEADTRMRLSELSKRSVERSLQELVAKEKRYAEAEKRYAEAEERMAKAIESGRVTKEQGEKRMRAFRKQILGESAKKSKPGKEQQAVLRLRYLEDEQRIQAAVEKGELSAEDAEKKLAALRERLFGQRDALIEQEKRAKKAKLEAEELKRRLEETQRLLDEKAKERKPVDSDAKARFEQLKKDLLDDLH